MFDSRKWTITVMTGIVSLFTLLAHLLKFEAIQAETLIFVFGTIGAYFFGQWRVDSNRVWTKEGAVNKMKEMPFWIALASVLTPFLGLIGVKLPLEIFATAGPILMGIIFGVQYAKIPQEDKEEIEDEKMLRKNEITKLKAKRR